MADTNVRRVVWRHKNSGLVPIEGVGLASNHGPMLEVAEMNKQLTDLEFWVEYWDESGRWVRMDGR